MYAGMKITGTHLLTLILLLCVRAFTWAQEAPTVPAPDWVGNLENVRWGSISVPENHDEPQGRHIDLSYLVIAAREPADRFPMVFFSGGPGGNSLDPGFVEFLSGYPPTAGRDVILFDQRGIGYSSPLPDMSIPSFNILAANADAAEELELTRQLILEYQEQCAELAIPLEFYNSFQSARDLGLLFKHLGYWKYNLIGSSYGTRLARVVQDLFPDYVHSTVLDSPAPISTDFLIGRLESYSEALEHILEYCNNQPECLRAYPALREDYLNALERLKTHPIPVDLNETETFWVNEQDAVYLLRRLMYRAESRETAPAFIRALLQGDPEPIKPVVLDEYEMSEALNLTLLLSVEHYENFRPEYTPTEIDATYRAFPLIPVAMGFFDAFYRAGKDWPSGMLPVAQRAFRPSETPTLLFVNYYDPVTPPQYAYLFRNTLSNAQLYVLDEGGHGGGNEDCKHRLSMAFMDDPAAPLDTSCLNLYPE